MNYNNNRMEVTLPIVCLLFNLKLSNFGFRTFINNNRIIQFIKVG